MSLSVSGLDLHDDGLVVALFNVGYNNIMFS